MNEPALSGQSAATSTTVAAPTFGKRAQSAALHLLILAAILTAVYFIFGWWFTPLMVAILVAAILLPLAFPHRYEDLISALSWLAIAALAWYYFGAQHLSIIAGLIGLVSLFAAFSGRGKSAF